MSQLPLDFYSDYVEKKCEEVNSSSSVIEQLSDKLGLSKLTDGIKDYLDTGILESLENSPLRTLAEDVLASTIQENSRRLSQNVTSILKNNKTVGRVTNTLQDVRSLAFDSVITVITFKNDMVLFFASQIAEECIKAIKEKRRVLLELQEAIRKLHNALLVLAGGGPFFSKYLADLRAALLKINQAKTQIDQVFSAFNTSAIFPVYNFERAKELLDEAYELIMPPITGTDVESLKEGFLKNVFVGPKYGDQLSMIMTIPKLAMEMLKAYDFYVLKVLKVNALLIAFQNCVQNIQQVTADSFRKRILNILEQEQILLSDLIESMALQLNGDAKAVQGPVNIEVKKTVNYRGEVTRTVTKPYSPNPTKTSSYAIAWSIRVKAARGLLELLDPGALQNLNLSNQALQYYNAAVAEIEEKDDRRTALAILRATDGREQLGDIEADLITFAFQANQAIIDSALTNQENGQFDEKSVIALGAKLNSRIQLSIDQDREIEQILMRFVISSKPLLNSIKDLGNSIYRILDDFGMDRASDFLRQGLFGDFFAMNAKTATYVGAAMSGLALVQNLLLDDSQKQCIQKAVNQIKSEETSKKLAAARNVQINYAKQQTANKKICRDRQNKQREVEVCSSQIDLNALKDNPLKSLSGLFNGVFGGSIADSLPGTEKFFANAGVSTIAIKDAAKTAVDAKENATKEMSAALESTTGIKVDPNSSFSDLQKQVANAKETAVGPAKELLEDSEISSKISEVLDKDALDTYKRAAGQKDLWKVIPDVGNIESSVLGSLGGIA